jgi:Ca-activated chloride channel family protein
MMRLAEPHWLWALLILIPAVALYIWRERKRQPVFAVSSLARFAPPSTGLRVKARHLLFVLELLTLSLWVVAMARPQAGLHVRRIDINALDIVLCLDISGSMQAVDFQPNNRLFVAKQVLAEFIQGRKEDRIGLVCFARDAYTECPLTFDYDILIEFLDQVDFGDIPDGTAVGMALAGAANRLRESEAKTKLIILLTDGVNNRGQIDPITAAQLCATLGIKVYTVGVGKRGMVKYPVNDPVFGRRFVTRQSEIDEATLQQIASITSGRFYRATDAEALGEIYQEISDLETTPVQVEQSVRYEDLYRWPLLLGMVLLLFDFALGATWLRRSP